MNKINLRKFAKDLRTTLPLDIISSKLVELIKQDEFFINSKNIMIFYPTKFEINLLSLICEDKNFYLPKVNGNNIEVCPFSDVLQESELNILEPCTNPVSPEILDLVIVPAIMCDKFGYRLGYGGGFYDRFLSKIKVKTICAIPKELFIEKLPIEKFDVKIDKIIVY